MSKYRCCGSEFPNHDSRCRAPDELTRQDDTVMSNVYDSLDSSDVELKARIEAHESIVKTNEFLREQRIVDEAEHREFNRHVREMDEKKLEFMKREVAALESIAEMLRTVAVFVGITALAAAATFITWRSVTS